MAKLIDKMIGIMGFADDEQEDEVLEEQEKEKIDQEEVRTSRKKCSRC